MIKRLSACIREYRLQTILTPLFMVGEVACECIIPLIWSTASRTGAEWRRSYNTACSCF